MTSRPWERAADAGDRLAGRRTLVTGAGTGGGELLGIGEAVAVLFADQGAQVGIVDIARERAEATKAMVDDVGGDAIVAVGDLTDVEDARRCVEEVAARFGGIDVLVNCAAITGGGGSPAEVDLAEWDAVLDVGLRAALLTTRHCEPHLKRSTSGAIVNISSIASTRAHGAGAYAAAKGALDALTRDWAYTLGRDGIRVNSVLPGHVITPMGDHGEEDRRRRIAAGLLGTRGDAWDVAWVAAFLASDEARFVTGVEVPVDAGATAAAAYAMQRLNEVRPIS
jgi:NAD(P)-dependent dehydrogenase (short-subunit alcohol dehydrogenase family)